MKQVYNLAGLMRKLNVNSFSELQELGYDVRSYLERREQELADELEAVRYGLQELDARDEELARLRTQSEINQENVRPYGRSAGFTYFRPPCPNPRASSNNDDDDIPFSSPNASSNDDEDDDIPVRSPRVSSRKYDSHDDADTDLPSNFGFDPSGSYSDPDYIYIGT